jgi:hypothetical protein
MRKLGLKLGLSCAALAACATTLVSTTFAWYTSNDSVKATGITGKTSDADDTLLLISKLGTKGSWGASVDLSKETAGVVLDPLAYDASADKYYGWNPDANAVSETAAEANKTAGSYISFVLYFKSGSGADLPVNIEEVTLTNTTESLPTKSVLAEGTGSTEATYSIDMFRATNIATTVYATKEVKTGTPAVAEGTRICYSLDSYAGSDSYKDGESNAHTYYNNVKSLGEDGIATDKKSSETGQKDFKTDFAKTGTNIGNTGEGGDASGLDNCLAVRFDIYLDGWDVACFDACRQQTFTLQMSFTSATE